MARFQRYKLAYVYAALEPHIDGKTMEIHSEKHHQAYGDKLNAALEGTKWVEKELHEILMSLDKVPENIRATVRNNGGGLFNHNHYFSILSPDSEKAPVGQLAEDINLTFGSFDTFKEEFSNAGINQFGSGWSWLATDENGENLHVHGHPNQDNPLMHNHIPVLGMDVWEHAYYLNYQNKRPDYVASWWNIVDWNKVEEIYQAALQKKVMSY